ncbi:MAG: YraN family protein [Clostridia bacterium]|nr:YraN family protein [Clostridia bacterium]
MNNTRQTGRQGENAACDFLIKNGYSIICRNYTARHGEIDIIAEDEKYIVFVEVKYKNNSIHLQKYGRPILAVNKEKRQHILSAVKNYIKRYDPQKKPRIDVIEIIGNDENNGFISLNIKHYKNAFGE